MGLGHSKDFDTSKLESFWNVIALGQETIDSFVKMWYHVFLWSLFSSFILHVIASMVAFASLRRHKIARYGPILILLSSVITPLLSYTITSAVIACVYRAATFNMYPLHAMFWGCGLTLCTAFFSFSNILATL